MLEWVQNFKYLASMLSEDGGVGDQIPEVF